MTTLARAYDFDMTQVGDEELAVLANECHFRPARDELLLRFHDFSDRVICRKARGRGLGRADIEDAQQEGIFWLNEAIKCYDARQLGIRCGCRFRTFLHCVLTVRFLDFVKHLTRQNRRCGRLVSGEDAIAAVGSRRRWNASTTGLLEQHELVSCVDEALDSLDATARDLWTQLARGRTLRQIAAETKVCYETLKYRKCKLLSTMIVRVRRAIRQQSGESP